ncbi:hypothetical protein [Pectobacterium versatile]|uniref:hypothetical protein n=1 Tax=Pectobacterium versatile TaxID=2488639 RepID=UPI001CCD89B5|nr:hypothetical protein [Pectobacterium versatile]
MRSILCKKLNICDNEGITLQQSASFQPQGIDSQYHGSEDAVAAGGNPSRRSPSKPSFTSKQPSGRHTFILQCG